jgi:hypothetical protein
MALNYLIVFKKLVIEMNDEDSTVIIVHLLRNSWKMDRNLMEIDCTSTFKFLSSNQEFPDQLYGLEKSVAILIGGVEDKNTGSATQFSEY